MRKRNPQAFIARKQSFSRTDYLTVFYGVPYKWSVDKFNVIIMSDSLCSTSATIKMDLLMISFSYNVLGTGY